MNKKSEQKYPGIRCALSGREVALQCAKEINDVSDASNISSMVGLALTGLRTGILANSKEVIQAHDSLFASAGKHLPFVINLSCSAALKSSLSFYAGHDAYHAVSDSGCFQFFAKNVQEVADLNIIAHKISELSLVPGLVAQDEVLTTDTLKSISLPEAELIEEYLGSSADTIESPTPAQGILFGKTRRRVPEVWSVDHPTMSGIVCGAQDSQSVQAAQRAFYTGHLVEITQQAIEEYAQLTGRLYDRLGTYRVENADYLIVGEGSFIETAEAVADYLRGSKGLKVGVINVRMLSPFPGDLLGALCKKRKGVLVCERLDQPLAQELPLTSEVRLVLSRCRENGEAKKDSLPYPDYAVYEKCKHIPQLFSASYGMGGGALQPGDLIAAVENMLSSGKQQRRVTLSVGLTRSKNLSPKQDVQQHAVLDAYPQVQDLFIRGSNNPDLRPKKSLSVQLHSMGDADSLKTGPELAKALYNLLGTEVCGGSLNKPEAVGQSSTYHFLTASEEIKISPPFKNADVVISLDQNLFKHGNPIENLKEKGTLVIQSSLSSHDVWSAIPRKQQEMILYEKIRVFIIDVSKIVSEELVNVEGKEESEIRNAVLLGALLATSGLSKPKKGEEEERWTRTVKEAPVKRGITELVEVDEEMMTPAAEAEEAEPVKPQALPVMLKSLPEESVPVSDIHRFWVQTGYPHLRNGETSDPVDPFIGSGIMPAATGTFRDFSSIRTEHPQFIPEKCTGCGDCWVVCPDSALPPLVNEAGEIFETIITRLENSGHTIKHLTRGVRTVEGTLHRLISGLKTPDAFFPNLEKAIDQTIAASRTSPTEKEELAKEFELFKREIKDFPLAITEAFYAGGKGGLLSITLDADKCKGCMECVKECSEKALVPVAQTNESVSTLREGFDFWQSLPSTNEKFIQRESLNKGNAYTTLFLDKKAYHSMVAGDDAPPGSAKKTAVHLLTSVVSSLMRARGKEHLSRVEELSENLEKYIKLKLSVNVADTKKLNQVMDDLKGQNFTLAELSEKIDRKKDPVDTVWLTRVTALLSELHYLKGVYSEEGGERTGLGMVGGTEVGSAWTSTFPYNPFSIPWTQHLASESPAVALGLFEGHMKKMADGFKAVRMAELELDEKYNPKEHDEYFKNFSWRDLTDEEFKLSPPVVIVANICTLYGKGSRNLNRVLSEGIPVKILLLDRLVLPAHLPLTGVAHSNTYVLQGGMGNIPHLVGGIVEGMETKHPALFHVFYSNVPEEGKTADSASAQAREALKSRAHPVFSYNPERGSSLAECLSLEGNPYLDDDYPVKTLHYVDKEGNKLSKEVPYTFADFVVTEGSFKKDLTPIDPRAAEDSFIPLPEFIELDADERIGRTPFIWSVNQKGGLCRLSVSNRLVCCCEERRAFWSLLKSLKRMDLAPVDEAKLKEDLGKEMVGKMTQSLVQLATGQGDFEGIVTGLVQSTKEGSGEKGKLS